MSMPASGKIAASETMMPLPIAVARCSWKRSMAAIRSSRFCVGGCTSAAVPAKDTMPIRVVIGWSAMNALAAFCAATSRLGSTSVARMLPETSMARITVSCCEGSVTTAVGRATARKQRGDRREEQQRRHVAAPAGRASHRLAHQRQVRVADGEPLAAVAAATRTAPRCSGTSSSSASASGHRNFTILLEVPRHAAARVELGAALAQVGEAEHGVGEVVVGGELQRVHLGLRELRAHLLLAPGGGRREAPAESRGRACRRAAARRSRRPGSPPAPGREARSPAGRTAAPRSPRGDG